MAGRAVGGSLAIVFRKISDGRHELEIARDDGRREVVGCETRSYLLHDLLHFAVESEAGLDVGFWGQLAGGKTLAEMNDRNPEAMRGGPDLEAIEQIVGALHGLAKGTSTEQVVAGMQRFAAALDATLPAWLTEPFVDAVQERMRRLKGRWAATAYGDGMELRWPDAAR